MTRWTGQAVSRLSSLSRENWEQVWLCLVSVAAARLADRQQYWIDEKITRELVHRWTAWELLTVLPQYQPHLPTWYLLPEYAGVGVTLLVSLAALPVTVYAAIRAAQTVYGDANAGFLAGSLTAVSPFLATQAGWLRMYAPVTAFLSLGLWLTLDDRYRAAAIPVVTACFLHPFAVFGAVWFAGVALRDRDTVAGLATLTVGGLPTVLLVAINTSSTGLTQQSTGVGHGIAPSLLKIVLTPVSSLVGTPHYQFQIAAALAATLVLLWPLPDRRIAAWILLPVVGIPAASYLLHPVFRLKYFGFVAPAVAVLCANPQRSQQNKIILAGSIGLLLLLSWLFRPAPAIVSRRFMFWF